MEELKQQHDNSSPHLKPWQFQPGVSGNPAGRPPGSSLKDYAKKYLAGMTDEERHEFMTGIDKKVIWEMSEGKPDAKTEAKVIVDVNNLKDLPDGELDKLISEGTSGESKEGES